MADAEQDLRDLLATPGEKLDTELKPWVDPRTPHGKEKIAKACIALRNNDGGRLIIGFEDDATPCQRNVPTDVKVAYHPDVIQTIVTKYSAEPFAVEVAFAEKDGRTYPIVTVPPGVQVPVAAKSDLKASDGTVLVRLNAVYVRSVLANGTYSSTDATHGDWNRLARICFDNREADIGRFVRRHLAALDLKGLAALVSPFAEMLHQPTDAERIAQELDRGRARFDAACKKQKLAVPGIGFREAVILVRGDIPKQAANDEFRRRLTGAAPSLSGWPPWVDLTDGGRFEDRPHVLDKGWEALIDGLSPNKAVFGPRVDFWRIEPAGIFYHLEGLDDDLNAHNNLPPGKFLDFVIQVRRVTEVIAIGLSFGRTLGCPDESTSLVFGFRWTKLEGRALTCWVDRRRSLRQGIYKALQAVYVTDPVVVPLETPPTGIAPHVENAVRGLFNLFDGFELSTSVLEGIVTDTLKRQY